MGWVFCNVAQKRGFISQLDVEQKTTALEAREKNNGRTIFFMATLCLNKKKVNEEQLL